MQRLKTLTGQLCIVSIACNLLISANACPRPAIYADTLLVGQSDTTAKNVNLQGSYSGTLTQLGSRDVFNVSMTLKQNAKTVEGSLTMRSSVHKWVYVTFSVRGEISNGTLKLRDEYETAWNGEMGWCKKMYTVTLDGTDNVILKGDWKNDGDLYFSNGRIMQGGNCQPGSFVLQRGPSGN